MSNSAWRIVNTVTNSQRSLALCELHVCLSALVLRVLPSMQLSDTTIKDVTYDYGTSPIFVVPCDLHVHVGADRCRHVYPYDEGEQRCAGHHRVRTVA